MSYIFKLSLTIFSLLFISSIAEAKCDTSLGRVPVNCDDAYPSYRAYFSQITLFKDYNLPGKCDMQEIYRLAETQAHRIEEACDEDILLLVAERTAGLACEQVFNNEELMYKSEYCNVYQNYRYNGINKVSNNPKQKNNGSNQKNNNLKDNEIIQTLSISEQYKDSPQLEIKNKLHIYNVIKISKFRNSSDKIFIESTSGNFAIPREEFLSAKKINFTTKLNEMIKLL